MADHVSSLDVNALKCQLVADEAMRVKAYVDSTGHITAGVGHNLSTHPIAHDILERWFDEDVEEVVAGLDARLPWWRQLSSIRQEAVANMAFNMGVDGLLTFHHMLAALEAGDFATAKTEMLASQWATQVGPRAHRLATMIETDTRCDGL